VPAYLVAETGAGRARARDLSRALLAVAAAFGLLSGALGAAMMRTLPFAFTSNAAVAGEAVSLMGPLVLSVMALSIWHCNEGLMLATGRAPLLSVMYAWNVFFFTTGSYVVLSRGLTLWHSWCVFASMHVTFATVVSIVLRLPGGVLGPALAVTRSPAAEQAAPGGEASADIVGAPA